MSDIVIDYARSRNWQISDRNVLVEGTTDVSLFQLASQLEQQVSNVRLIDHDLSILAAGQGDRGGTQGVVRELNTLRSISQGVLSANGRPKYRFIGLLDNDKAGRGAVKLARGLDSSIHEYKDIFRLHPEMPSAGSLDQRTLAKSFERLNSSHRNFDWELEDLIDNEFVECFLAEEPGALQRDAIETEGKVHRDYTQDGKHKLHKFVYRHATREDVLGVIRVLKAIRFYLNLPTL